jgi:uncharacterized membrane protein
MELVNFPIYKTSITFLLNEKIFDKLSIIRNSRAMGLRWLLLRLTAKLFNSLHLFFTPAKVGVLLFIALN